MTPEEITIHINAAFDSVSLINNVIDGLEREDNTLEEKKIIIEQNVGHLSYMLSFEWFSSNLTLEQTTQINNVIIRGNTYIDN
jgi:hypothetical protein